MNLHKDDATVIDDNFQWPHPFSQDLPIQSKLPLSYNLPDTIVINSSREDLSTRQAREGEIDIK